VRQLVLAPAQPSLSPPGMEVFLARDGGGGDWGETPEKVL
jgi:hypothetical protein